MTVSDTSLPFQLTAWRSGSIRSSPRSITLVSSVSATIVARDRILPAQERADAFDQKALRERLFHVVIRAHAQAEDLVDLVILGREEDDGHRRFLAEPLKQVHAVHARHLDIENGHVGQFLVERIKGLLAVIIGFDLEALGLEVIATDVRIFLSSSTRAILDM